MNRKSVVVLAAFALAAPAVVIACANAPTLAPCVPAQAASVSPSTSAAAFTGSPVSSAAPSAAPTASSAPTDDARETRNLPLVTSTQGVRIPMRDGISLNATVYRPMGVTEKLPVVVAVTPYDDLWLYPWAVDYAERGYVTAMVDVRGRGSSGGDFDPWHPHPTDVFDVIEWLARLPWSNGKVGLMGSSYMASEQWWGAREAPPHLATMVPIAAARLGVDFPGRPFAAYMIQWLTAVQGRPTHVALFSDGERWGDLFCDFFFRKLPFRTLDSFVGTPSPAFQQALRHPSYDAFWQALGPSPAQYKAIQQPVLTITGYFDGDQPGALSYYREHMQYGAPEDTAEHYLVLGPWDHLGNLDPQPDVEGQHISAAGLIDTRSLTRGWYDWRMKGGPKPDFLKDRVAYYVMGEGAEVWKYAPTLEAATRDRMRMFLGSAGGAAGDLAHAGSLAATPPDATNTAGPDHYIYDPNDVTDHKVTDLRGDALVYRSDPIAEDFELAGTLHATLWLSMDVPDTDLRVVVSAIGPDGKKVVLGTAVLRARYRESLATEKLVPAGVPQRYDFDHFLWGARRIPKGSRIEMVVGALNEAGIEKNYNSGGVVADESGKDARVAHVSLLHDAVHPSVLELPIGR